MYRPSLPLRRSIRLGAACLLAASIVSLDLPSTSAAPTSEQRAGAAGARTAESSPLVQRNRPGCVRAPKFRHGKTRFGISVSTSSMNLPDAMRQQQNQFGRLPVVRTFDPDVPPIGSWDRRRDSLRGKMVVTSFRMPPQGVLAGRYDRQLRDYFKNAPRETPILWSYIHEPEPLIEAGEFTAPQYRKAFRRIVNLAHRSCRENLFPTMILTGWTADPSSGRSWRTYYPGRGYVSVLGWDPYNSATSRPSSYVAPRHLYKDVVRVSRKAGKPFGIAETGSMLVPGDNGARRAAWLHRVGKYFTRKGARFVTYFQSTHDGDFELRDQASVRAWRAWISR